MVMTMIIYLPEGSLQYRQTSYMQYSVHDGAKYFSKELKR